jgi:uncharacterized protein
MKRVLAFPLVRLVLVVVVFACLAAPVVLLTVRAPNSAWRSVAANWILAGLLTAAVAGVERLAAGRSLAAVGLGRRDAARDFALGALFGGGLFSIVVLELALAGLYRVVGVHATWDLAIAALLLVADAFFEELLFRGVLFRLLEEWSGTWIALVFSALLFGLAHSANPGATLISSLAIALEAGVLLAAAYVVTRNLWLPIGLHFAWNFFEGPIYGTQVSGHVFLTSLLAAHVSGPPLLTGGSFGPEAGLAAIVTCLAAAIALLAYAVRRSLTLSPAWKRRAYDPGSASQHV